MDGKTNRQTVLDFCHRLSDRDYGAMRALMTDDASWWGVGLGTPTDLGYMLPRVQTFLDMFDSFRFEVAETVAERDIVVVQATSRGTVAGRPDYRNVYLLKFRVREGQISQISEFFDPSQSAKFRAREESSLP